jgi:hypothetical protein
LSEYPSAIELELAEAADIVHGESSDIAKLLLESLSEDVSHLFMMVQ